MGDPGSKKGGGQIQSQVERASEARWKHGRKEESSTKRERKREKETERERKRERKRERESKIEALRSKGLSVWCVVVEAMVRRFV